MYEVEKERKSMKISSSGYSGDAWQKPIFVQERLASSEITMSAEKLNHEMK